MYNCHGSIKDIKVELGPFELFDEKIDLMYYCRTYGYLRSFENIMDEIRQFLYTHPTETVILNIQSEYEYSLDYFWTIFPEQVVTPIIDAILAHSPESLSDDQRDLMEQAGLMPLFDMELSDNPDKDREVLGSFFAELMLRVPAFFTYY
nr:hypothetical protein [Clostridia bacterium]